jgi:hypothetical protein
MMNFIIGILLKGICKLKGLELFKAESYDELLASDDFRQRTYLQYLSLEKLPVTPELLKPGGLVACWCLRKQNQLVGTVSLIDLAGVSPFTASVFADARLEYDPMKTYEFTRLALDQRHQRSDHLYFLLLVYACYRETIANGRNSWLACSHRRVVRHVHKLGGTTKVIARGAKIVQDGSYHAQYWSNMKLDSTTLSEYQAYLIGCDKSLLSTAINKFLKRKITQLI